MIATRLLLQHASSEVRRGRRFPFWGGVYQYLGGEPRPIGLVANSFLDYPPPAPGLFTSGKGMSAIIAEDRRIVRFTTVAAGEASALGHGGADWCDRCIVAFLVVGLAIRLIRYLLRFPLWGDEAMLAANLLDRDYAGLMQPLNFHQVAPLLFLWIELAAVKLWGFHEWSLRLFPLLCSIAGMFLFHRLARLLLRGPALVLAVGIFAATYSGIRYAAEVKPYGVDVMVSTLLLLLAVRWWRQPNDVRWLWALAAIVALVLGISYPAVFVAGGVSLAVAAVLLAQPSRRGWLAWTVYNVALAGGFLVWYRLAVGAQTGAELGTMSQMWDESFPPRNSFTGLLVWLARAHTGSLLAVPVGGDHWGSIGTTLVCLVAVGVLFGKGRYRLLVLCGAPLVLNLLAAALRRFPYGGHMRLALYLVPMISILAGIGVNTICRWLGRNRSAPQPARPAQQYHGERLTRPAATAVIALLVLAALTIARDFVLPGKERQEIRKRDFAAWFWSSMERDHEVVAIGTDLKRIFPPPGVNWENCVSPQFMCNQRIYSPRQASGRSHDLDRVSRQRPLACVQYWSHAAPYDQAAFDCWLGEMRQRYDLTATQHYTLLQDNDEDRVPEPPDRVDVYELVPREESRRAG